MSKWNSLGEGSAIPNYNTTTTYNIAIENGGKAVKKKDWYKNYN